MRKTEVTLLLVRRVDPKYCTKVSCLHTSDCASIVAACDHASLRRVHNQRILELKFKRQEEGAVGSADGQDDAMAALGSFQLTSFHRLDLMNNKHLETLTRGSQAEDHSLFPHLLLRDYDENVEQCLLAIMISSGRAQV
jgi:hypothetical protein